jgi:MFS family permease
MCARSSDYSFSKNFNLMVVNMGLSRFGISAFNLIILWIILFETHSPFLSGLGDGILSAPLFFSFIVGAFVDKSGKKKALIIVAGVARALTLSLIFLGFYIDNVILIVISIYVSGFLIGFTSDILSAVNASWTKKFLDEEHYKTGSSLVQSVSSIAEGAGYIASGLLLAAGFAQSFLSIFVVFIVSIIPILFIKTTEVSSSESAIDSVKQGLKFIMSSKPIIQILIIALLGNMIFGMAGVMFTALVQLHFKLPAIYISMIFSIVMVGIVIGSLLVAKVKGKLGSISILSYFIIGFSLCSITIIQNIFLIILPVLIIGIVIGIINVLVNTAILKILPENMMARIQGAFNTFSLAATFVSGMIGGVVIQLTSSTTAFLIIGMLTIIITPFWFTFKELASIKI